MMAAPMFGLLTTSLSVGLLATSLSFGLRHGIDWDHIAAIADLTSSAETRRRGWLLSLFYALGHAVVVFVLGLLAIALSTTIPDGVASWFGRVVGFTLLFLGVWVLIELLRKGEDFRLRSRWMLVLSGTFAGLRKVRNARAGRVIEVDHQHPHEHDPADAVEHGATHAHDHAHDAATPHAFAPDDELVEARSASTTASTLGRATEPRRRWYQSGHHRGGPAHAHEHHHAIALPGDPFTRYEGRTAAGIGMLHGVGVESPTQIAVFVAALKVGGVGNGMLLLAAWCVGLVLANVAIALLAAFGLLSAERNFRLYAFVSVVVAIGSIAMGVFMIGGFDVLPELEV